MLSQMKDLLQADDDRSTAIAPLLRKVASLQRDVNRGVRRATPGAPRRLLPHPRRSVPPRLWRRPSRPCERTPGNTEASPDDVKAQLAALRDARVQAQKDLAAARTALKAKVNARQEAQLVLVGILD